MARQRRALGFLVYNYSTQKEKGSPKKTQKEKKDIYNYYNVKY
jgi:hypothetical protein